MFELYLLDDETLSCDYCGRQIIAPRIAFVMTDEGLGTTVICEDCYTMEGDNDY